MRENSNHTVCTIVQNYVVSLSEFARKKVQRVADYLASLPASDNPNAFILSLAAERKANGLVVESVLGNSC
jgi:hypothetical protein